MSDREALFASVLDAPDGLGARGTPANGAPGQSPGGALLVSLYDCAQPPG